jgi:itaconate CoA-transferase
MFAIQSEREWRRFCSDVMRTPDLADDPRFSTNALRVANRATLESMIDSLFRTLPRVDVIALLERADIPMASMNDIPSVVAHEQLTARRRWVSVDSPSGEIPALLPPHNLMHVTPRMGRIPSLGEHTNEVLSELRST